MEYKIKITYGKWCMRICYTEKMIDVCYFLVIGGQLYLVITPLFSDGGPERVWWRIREGRWWCFQEGNQSADWVIGIV